MKYKYSPQFNEQQQLAYKMDRERETVKVTMEDVTDVFDFSDLEPGDKVARNEETGRIEAETNLPINPIAGAWKDDRGQLHLILLYYYSDPDDVEAKATGWKEVRQ